MGRFFSDELFHFVGRNDPLDHERNFDVLKKILSAGCISHPPHRPGSSTVSVRINWKEALVGERLIVPDVVCFCDIPFEHLPLHLSKYGPFGLSLAKAYATRYGARPVMYVPLRADDRGSINGTVLLKTIEQAYRGFREQIFEKANLPSSRFNVHGAKPQTLNGAISMLDSVIAKDFLAFIKPFDSELPEDDPNFFYSEREW